MSITCRDRRGVGLLTASLLTTGCATGGISLNASVPDDVVRYVDGSTGARLSAQTGQRISNVRLDPSDSALLIDGGRHGSLAIPYASITYSSYGPVLTPYFRGGPLRGPQRWASVTAHYPSSTQAHRFRAHYLKIGFRGANPALDEELVLALGKTVARRTLARLERQTSHAVAFEVVEACVTYKTPKECGIGSPADLKGLSTVLVDTSGSREWYTGESHDRITSAITEARLGLQLVSRLDDASIVLAFRYFAGTRPQWLQGRYDSLDRAVGEVYVASPDGLRLVMTFDQELRVWRTKLATRFAEVFIRAYKQGQR